MTEDWFQKHVLAALQRLEDHGQAQSTKFDQLNERVTRIEERTTMRAAFVSGIVSIAAAIGTYFLGRKP